MEELFQYDEEGDESEDVEPETEENVHTLSQDPKTLSAEKSVDYPAEETISSYETAAKLLQELMPLSHQVDLVGSTRAVMCLSLEPSGNRLVTGSLDYFLHVYDFGGMDG